MQGMKILVAVMSVMIVICIGLLGYGLATKTGELVAAKPHTEKTAEKPAETMPELVLPALSRIERMSGDANGAVLYVESAEGDYIYFVTPATSSRIRIKRK